MIIKPAEYYAVERNEFYTFLHRAFKELNPNVTFLHNWHIELIAAKLQLCFQGVIKRLIINVPPRSLKSHCAAVAFPAYVLGCNPSAQIICASYGQDLANKHSFDCRTLMASEWFKSLFRTRLSPQKQSLTEFATTQNGFRLSTSVGGVMTGRGCDIAIIDDPLKPDEALSETQRNAVNNWFSHTLYSRLNDKRTGCIIIIMQRLHQDDLVGHVLEQEPWDVLSLPAIAEEDETHLICSPYNARTVRRRAGEALHPEREPLEVLENLRRTLGEYNFAGQYQQQPAPLGGGMVKAHWFKIYTPGEEPARFDLIFQSWDTANKSTELSDYSVCTTWGCKDSRLYLLHVHRKRLEYPDLKRSVFAMAAAYGAKTILIEDKSSGIPLIQDLIREGAYGVTRYEPKMDKIMRLHSVTSTIENGFVHLPTAATWLSEYLAELTTFPNAKHDDQTDSTSQALDWIKTRFFTLPVIEYYQREAVRLGLLPQSDLDRSAKHDAERIAVNDRTGQKIAWKGQGWMDCNTGTVISAVHPVPSGFIEVPEFEPCPECRREGHTTIGRQKRCSNCGHQWPPIQPSQARLSRSDALNRGTRAIALAKRWPYF